MDEMMDTKPYERQPKEPPKAWEAFTMYRDMGLQRSLDKVRQLMGKAPVHTRNLEVWSSKWRWVERARAWDHHLDVVTREAAESKMPIWEQRRQESLQANLIAASIFRQRLMEMMNRPLIRERIEDVAGKQIIINEPAGWSWNTIAQGLKIVAELEAETIAEGLLENERENFNPATASEDELREYVMKRIGNRKG